MPRREPCEDDPERRDEELNSLVPKDQRKVYDMRKVLNHIFDRNSIFEIGKFQGRSQITALARLNSYPVGLLANDTKFLGGAFDYDVGEKFQRFIDMCDTFHLPIVNISDQPGFAIGKKSELHETIRRGVRASFAIIQATVPCGFRTKNRDPSKLAVCVAFSGLGQYTGGRWGICGTPKRNRIRRRP
jgi:acetyl-CoA carboxylase carboxyltransferase component